MFELIMVTAFLIGYVLLMKHVLPRLGVPT